LKEKLNWEMFRWGKHERKERRRGFGALQEDDGVAFITKKSCDENFKLSFYLSLI